VKSAKRAAAIKLKTSNGGSMAAKLFAVLIFLAGLASAPASAQLGPKDGGDLRATELERVKVGQAAPDFTLEDVDGKGITLSDFRGKKTVALVFYRGYW
jgi:cytochrome oxidase Cu insertion factor (SCO1/SenC/PrrC family)